ncbi:MAG: cytochrome c oxidase assembly protein [Anaerolineales bacterium]|nr:cytochrome c oxidase assembly protein [Anaerolineales bacterium]
MTNLNQKQLDTRSWKWEWAAWIAGIFTFAAAVLPPMDEFVDASFSAHMLQHMILTMVSAPLLAYALPLLYRNQTSSWFTNLLDQLTRPAVALIISAVGIWIWHIPFLYDVALEDEFLHFLEHVVFLLAFVLFWRPLMSNKAVGGYLKSNEGRVLYLTIGMFTTGLLAAYITLAKHLIYTHYAPLEAGVRSPLADQQLGGAYMLVVGTVAMVAAILLTLRDDP